MKKILSVALLILSFSAAIAVAQPVAYDTQPIGLLDDGTEQGVLRVTPVRGDLTAYPFFNRVSSTCGGAAGTYINVYSGINGARESRGGVIQCALAQGITNYASIRFAFSGRALGLSLYSYHFDLSPLTIVIDGVFYPLTNRLYRSTSAASTTTGVTGGCALSSFRGIIADGLSDTLHECEIRISGDASRAQTYQFVAFYADAGLRQPPVTDGIWAVLTFNFTAANTNSLSVAGTSASLLSEIEFCNNSVSNAIVRVHNSSTVIWQSALPAAGTTKFLRQLPISIDASTIKISCDQTNVVATIYGTN